LPEFAIRHDELPEALEDTTDYRKLTEVAARRVYNTEKSDTRGEIGELLLHAICRQFSGTFPTVSKVYYKTASNDFAKGFDLVHTRYAAADDEFELWLGEAKFYEDGVAAVSESINSLRQHLEAGFLTAEKILLGGKISADTPAYSKLEWLFDRDTALDEIFRRLIVPILIAYDSQNTASFENEDGYNEKLLLEFAKFQTKFSEGIPEQVSAYCFYVPMDTKKKLIAAFDKKLGAFL
jgi:hypothetical protein